MTKLISFGYRCSTASFLKYGLNMKSESYPFDWLVSSLSAIRQCIESDFKEFLKIENYRQQEMETCNIVDGVKTHIRYETMYVNTLYETNMENTYSYSAKLALNHKTIHNDYDYYVRCIQRLHDAFASNERKVYIHMHPLMGPCDFERDKDALLAEFDAFHTFLQSRANNIFGLFFLLVKSNEKTVVLKETKGYVVHLVYCHEALVDVGTPFDHDTNDEIFRVICLLMRMHIYTPTGAFLEGINWRNDIV